MRGLLAACLSIFHALYGCRALTGLGDLTFDLDGGGIEDCTNGVDDDGDGDIDCADSDCGASGYACAAGAPEGWSGPGALFEDPAAPAPSCPAAYPRLDFEGGASPSAGSASCSPCACEPPKSSCADSSIEAYPGKTCKGRPSVFDTPDGACVPIGEPSSVLWESATPTCTVTVGEADIPPVTWASSAAACSGAALGGGCGGGLCAPRPAAPFGSKLCIWHDEDVDCPAGYPEKRILSAIRDDRLCTACACAVENAPACEVTITLFSDPACQTPLADMFVPGICAQAQAQAVRVDVVKTGAASCSVSGGEAHGSLREKEMTFCCER